MNQIQPRRDEPPVKFLRGDWIRNINDPRGYEYLYSPTNNNTIGSFPPTYGGVGRKSGVMFLIVDGDITPDVNINQPCYQYWHSRQGDLFVRVISKDRNSAYHVERDWVKINGTDSNLPEGTLDKFFIKPESQGQFGEHEGENIDELVESGIYRTHNNAGGVFPSGISKWGILMVFVENDGKGQGSNGVAVVQMWISVHDSISSIYLRTKKSNQPWSAWALPSAPAGGGALPDDYFPATDTDAIPDAGGFIVNGFKRTDTSTVDLPPELDEAGKEGVIQFIQEHADGTGTGVQYYVPVQGKYAGQTFTRVRQDVVQVTRAGERQAGVQWSKWLNDSDTKVKIKDNRNTKVPKPSEYKGKDPDPRNGYVSYEWKWGDSAGDQGIRLPAGEDSNSNPRCVLVTLEPDPQQTVTGNNYSDICQVAYFKSGNTYIRHGKDNADDWGEWKPLGQGGTSGGGITFNDIESHLINQFNEWYKGVQ